jgi:hypothetical protein
MTLGNYTIKNCKCCKLFIFLKIITQCINKSFKLFISRNNKNYENRQAESHTMHTFLTEGTWVISSYNMLTRSQCSSKTLVPTYQTI